MTVAILSDALTRRLGRTVIDRTDIAGTYNLVLEWTPDQSQVPGLAENGVLAGSNSGGPTIFSALQDQLGLKLEGIKAAVEVIVIDAVKKPTEN